MKLLLDAKANIDKVNEDGVTPLLAATMNNRIKCMKLLLDYGADPEIEDIFLWNPLNFVTTGLFENEVTGDDENNVKYNEALKLLLPKVLSIIAKRVLIVAYAKNMIFDTAFIVFKKCVEYDMSFDYEEYDVNNPDTNTELYKLFNEEMIKYKVLSIIAKRVLIVAYAKNMIFDTAFIVFKKCVEYDVNNPDTNTALYKLFNKEMIKYKE
jgi:hypothetical protein